MKILFYLAAGNGDLINFTGILNLIKARYPDYIFDFLIIRKQFSIIENNPCINKVLFFDEYPEIPNHCTLDGHDDAIRSVFNVKYDFILNCWGCKIKDPRENNYDYADVMAKLMIEYGFDIRYTRREIVPTFYFSAKDYDAASKCAVTANNRKILLIEDQCFSAQNLQAAHNAPIFEYLKNTGYVLAGNGDGFDINISQLNLKSTKLFFEIYCYGFLGLSSGITCAIYAYPNFYANKKVIVSGQTPSWNFSEILFGNKNYYYFKDYYDIQDIKSIL